VFTKPVDAASAADVSSYRCESYTYLLHETYGSDEVEKAPCAVTAAVVAADGMSVQLTLENLRAGFVHELHAQVRATDGEELLHDVAYYSLIVRPQP
jgi:hypothetical protein